MICQTASVAQSGSQYILTKVESSISNGIPDFKIIGLADTVIKESSARVKNAIINSKLNFPTNKITINMLPANFSKKGSHFDLAIAISILQDVYKRQPSYVLGGRAMEIVHNDDDLRIYMATAVKEISHDAPILVDKYIVGKECEVDAICDGKNVYIPGIMEHIERAGIHSGDSISVYPAPTISQKVKDDIISYTIKIGKGFKFIGLFNIQFIVDEREKVYVLEVNPRSSRTVPLLSKITDVPMSEIATRCVIGESLENQGYDEGIKEEVKRYFVKTPVFSFGKLRSVDTTLGPEMKSTGEALGSDVTLQKALYKALIASGVKIPMEGNILVTVADKDKDRCV